MNVRAPRKHVQSWTGIQRGLPSIRVDMMWCGAELSATRETSVTEEKCGDIAHDFGSGIMSVSNCARKLVLPSHPLHRFCCSGPIRKFRSGYRYYDNGGLLCRKDLIRSPHPKTRPKAHCVPVHPPSVAVAAQSRQQRRKALVAACEILRTPIRWPGREIIFLPFDPRPWRKPLSRSVVALQCISTLSRGASPLTIGRGASTFARRNIAQEIKK